MGTAQVCIINNLAGTRDSSKVLLISNTTDEVHSLYETLQGNQVLGGLVLFYWQKLNRGKFHRAYALEFIWRLVLQISELLECLSGREEQTSECLPSMTGNRLKGITVKICRMFCSTGVWDIPVVVATNKPKMELVEKVLLMVQLVLRKPSASYFHVLFQQSPQTLSKKPLNPISRSWHFIKLLGGFGTQALTIQLV